MSTLIAAPKKMLELTVDGQSVRVMDGSTILDACRLLGIDTPTTIGLETPRADNSADQAMFFAAEASRLRSQSSEQSQFLSSVQTASNLTLFPTSAPAA